ncbi:MAG TPA: acetylglutamate kinase [Polyangiaceae bacterium]|jgi:acetylglutamate kinase|nr:acetylglutamate kinase [Polyangiaceae bacterium]
MALTDCIVIKLGGEVVASPYMAAIAADIAQLQRRGERVVLVHGGGPQATELQKRLGQTPHIVAGRRITDAQALEVIKMVVAGKVNVDACAALVAAGARPVGLHGASALVVQAKKRPPRVVTGAGPDPVDFGHVGDVTGVNDALITLLSEAGYVPAIACLGADEQGNVFNINADSVANRLAVALDAKALMLVSDVPGVLRDVRDPSSRIPRLTVAEGRKAIADGIVRDGMIPKLEESFAALTDGVRAVHIVGHLRPAELATEVASPGSVGSVLVA